MATHCAFYLNADSVETVVEMISSFYDSGSYKMNSIEGTDLPDLYGKRFKVFGKEPTRYTIRRSESGYIIVDYNCFVVPTDLIKALSDQTSSDIMNIVFQTTSSSYWFTYFSNGSEVRSIGYADGEFYENEGAYFDFESDPIGIDINDEEDSEPFYMFCEESLIDYSQRLNFPGLFENDWDGSGSTLSIKKKSIFGKLFSS